MIALQLEDAAAFGRRDQESEDEGEDERRLLVGGLDLVVIDRVDRFEVIEEGLLVLLQLGRGGARVRRLDNLFHADCGTRATPHSSVLPDSGDTGNGNLTALFSPPHKACQGATTRKCAVFSQL